jgi:hypothetical protein
LRSSYEIVVIADLIDKIITFAFRCPSLDRASAGIDAAVLTRINADHDRSDGSLVPFVTLEVLFRNGPKRLPIDSLLMEEGVGRGHLPAF